VSPIPGELSETVISDGQVICGGSASSTVTVKLQGEPVLPKQITLLVPTGRNEPDGGLQVNVPQLLPDGEGVA